MALAVDVVPAVYQLTRASVLTRVRHALIYKRTTWELAMAIQTQTQSGNKILEHLAFLIKLCLVQKV